MYLSGTITASAVQELLAVLIKARPETAGLNARAGIPKSALQDSAAMLPLATFTAMLEAAADETGNTKLGLELGRRFNVSALGPISDLMKTARTLGEALDKFGRYFESIQTSTRSTFAVSNGTVRLAYSITDPAIRFREQDAGFTMAIEHAMLADFVGPSWKVDRVEFAHPAGSNLGFYQEHFACPLRFQRQENALIFPARFLDVALREADAKLHARIEAGLADSIKTKTSRLDLVQSIEAWMQSSLCQSASTDIEIAASDFGMSLRSLQRKLARHGISHLDIRNRVRSKIAQCLLAETHLPVTSIALQLGYSESSAFSRGFKAQVGQTPAAFRKSSRHR